MNPKDLFAAAALSGLMANTQDWVLPESEGDLAEWAWSLADAMVAERQKRRAACSKNGGSHAGI